MLIFENDLENVQWIPGSFSGIFNPADRLTLRDTETHDRPGVVCVSFMRPVRGSGPIFQSKSISQHVRVVWFRASVSDRKAKQL